MVNKLSLFLALIALPATLFGSEPRWPMAEEPDLSSGFGDFRDSRFHAGIDLRTGGVVGKKVLAPVDGWISRMKTAYNGYGRALYFTGDDGYIYVFGHLMEYAPELERGLRKFQLAAERYGIDQSFRRDSLRVKKGELIALSGETGAGAPHLHFEKRTGDNIPLNPLTHGFAIKDKTAPLFGQVGFQLVDNHSLFPDGKRTRYQPSRLTAKGYRLDSTLHFSSPFGLIVESFDRTRIDGMSQATYDIELTINGQSYFQVRFDSLPYENADAAKLEYDHAKAADGEKRNRRLFDLSGNTYAGSRSARTGRGVFGLEGEPFGKYDARVIARDAFGNSSELLFSFTWGPEAAIFAHDSTVIRLPDTTFFYFTPRAAAEQFPLDSVGVQLARGDAWGNPKNVSIDALPNKGYKIRVIANRTASAILRLVLFPTGGGTIPDTIFNGRESLSSAKVSLSRDIVDGGIIFTVKSPKSEGGRPRIDLFGAGKRIESLFPRLVSDTRQVLFVPAMEKYESVSRIELFTGADSALVPVYVDTCRIHVVGHVDRQEIAFDDRFSLHVERDNLYGPQFIEISHTPFLQKGLKGIVSDSYGILPELMLTRSPMRITYRPIEGQSYNQYTGLCWLNVEADQWVWLDEAVADGKIKATTWGGGTFAAVFDRNAPILAIKGVKDTLTYTDRRPRISFTINEDLSGIRDDSAIRVKVNGKWVPAEYDIEKKICRIILPDQLPLGEQHLAIQVTDRAGHTGERYMRFFITEPKSAKTRGKG